MIQNLVRCQELATAAYLEQDIPWTSDQVDRARKSYSTCVLDS